MLERIIKSGRARLGLLALVALASVMVGCTTEAVRKEPKEVPKIPITSILVMPVSSLTQDIGEGAAQIEQQLYKELKSAGYDVILPDVVTFKRLYDAALVESGSIYNPNTKSFLPLDRSVYMRYMIQNLQRYYEHDVLVDPEVLLRPAKIVGDDAVWDGVQMEVDVRNEPRSGYRLPPLGKGISLRIASYTRKGAGIELTFAGISIPYIVFYNDGASDIELKDAFFTDKELDKAVDRALEPLLQRVTEAK
ncbi:Uncharacterised protein [BD1-7 clade bacterium]|uniref:Lipoprotein n=1 Tax=BD1-7 clade bacterium TaxID=2029982 RepID=A0A5S9QIW7_9GAMM|nr:Uncharacterised protein [BD1-7 clade bacterium]CAA0118779.1 Uncharacterised protein [BD1-7 clade bacterium]